MSSVGALIGFVFGIGLLMSTLWIAKRRRPDVVARLSSATPSNAPAQGPIAALRLLLLGSGSASRTRDLDVRLARAGRPGTARDFRMEQLTWSAGGTVLGAGLGLLVTQDEMSLASVGLLALVGAVIGALACRRRLTSRIKVRQRTIDLQLPAVAELLAFAVSAGQSPGAALESIADTTAGELPGRIRMACDRQRTGMGLEQSLRGLSRDTGSASVERFVDGLMVCLERGTPVAEVLRAQAADARADQRRMLMEQAGRKDIAMLLPVVFLILPIVVVIAMYPGFTGIQLLVP